MADFPVPAEVIGKIRIPGSFSPRSPQHRKDLAATMRNRLAAAGPGARGGARCARRTGTDAAPEAASDIADLRRRLRRHPCHDCPDRENHARYAERYMRLARETEALERRVAGRSHVIARTFDRVCRVLERLGYLAGDVVTPDGQRLGRLYTELDLLAAECLRRGLWDDLSPAELAACVSALSFESRQADDAQPPRLPKGRVPEALAATVRTWGELDQLEKDNELSFLREPDLGFAWAAYRWARGARLETVLDESPDLTPGDFVRSVKQLIDLLDQIASVPPHPRPSGLDATALSPGRHLRRPWHRPAWPRPPAPPSTRCAAAWSPTPPSRTDPARPPVTRPFTRNATVHPKRRPCYRVLPAARSIPKGCGAGVVSVAMKGRAWVPHRCGRGTLRAGNAAGGERCGRGTLRAGNAAGRCGRAEGSADRWVAGNGSGLAPHTFGGKDLDLWACQQIVIDISLN